MIGENIGNIMRSRGLTQAQIAASCGISQSSLSAIIRGESEPKEKTAERIALALGCSVEELKTATADVASCPRCGSKAITEWHSHGSGSVRLRCDYCELDTGEQNSRAKALSVFRSYEKKKERRNADSVHVLSLAELLDSECFDNDDVRIAWFENRGLFIVPSLIRCGIAERELGLVKVVWFGNREKTYMLEQYGQWWRCWSEKVTEAQSDATPWKE